MEEGEISREDIPRKVGEAEKGMEMDVSPRPLCFFLSFARWFGRQSCLLEKAKKKRIQVGEGNGRQNHIGQWAVLFFLAFSWHWVLGSRHSRHSV